MMLRFYIKQIDCARDHRFIEAMINLREIGRLKGNVHTEFRQLKLKCSQITRMHRVAGIRTLGLQPDADAVFK